MLVLEEVGKCYPSGGDALRGVSFRLTHGELAFLTGHSGAGKSTLLRLVFLLERCSAGQIHFDGQEITHLSSHQIPYLRRQIGFVFPEHRLLAHRTVLDNVALPLFVLGQRRSEAQERARAALQVVGLVDKARLRPQVLSEIEQRRLTIARAMISRPPLLLADEPIASLDTEQAHQVLALFEHVNQIGSAVLIATRDISLVRHTGHRLLQLDNGELIADYPSGGFG